MKLFARSKARQQQQAQKRLAADLAKEAKTYEQLIQGCYTRLGEAWLPKSDHDSASGQRKRKVQKVRFEHIKTSPEIIYFKILTRRKTMFGFKNALPYHVRVMDLIKEETLTELSYATERVISARYDDPRKGAWLQVHRLEGLGGLPRLVTYKAMLDKYPADMSNATLVLGIGEHRTVHHVDLADHPHALIAGATRSGKSNMVNQLICSLMRFTDPSELQFILIDLKRLEFSHYKKSGHLFKPIVVDAKSALETLQQLVDEIGKRTVLLEESGAKEIAEWNASHPDQRLPRIVCVIDEFAELMLASDANTAKAAGNLVARACNLGRAVGIHLWVCTQRPAREVVSNAVKINMPLVIGGRTQNAAQSGVILGNGDAAKIPLIPGRMIYQSGSEQYIVQTPYILKEDISEAVRISKGRAEGLIAVEGIEPVICKLALVEWLVAHREGVLQNIDLTDYGIGPKLLKAFVKWAIQSKSIEAGDNLYDVERKGQDYRLTRAGAINLTPSPPIATPEPAKPTLTLVPAEDERKAKLLKEWRAIKEKRIANA